MNDFECRHLLSEKKRSLRNQTQNEVFARRLKERKKLGRETDLALGVKSDNKKKKRISKTVEFHTTL